jgi:hypothetical protein
MAELILSDITVMGPGYCVVGLEQLASGAFRSVRPLPPWGFAWREPFPLRRGDGVRFEKRLVSAVQPHVEEVQSAGLTRTERSVGEDDLVECLKKAEVSQSLERLFDCPVQKSPQGGRALWVTPSDAVRSVCGCEYTNLRFRLFPEPEGFKLRAEVTLSSNERLPSIPVVDREWHRFTSQLVRRIQRSDTFPFAERFLNGRIRSALLMGRQRFARIGLPRPRGDQRCWLMLDSLFPQPDASWLELL